MRNFDDLSAHDFEVLVQSLLGSEIGLRLTPSDAVSTGVSLEGSSASGRVVVGCLHDPRNGRIDLDTAVPALAEALRRLRPKRYILAVAAEIDGQRRSVFAEIIRRSGVEQAEILALDDLNAMLERNPQIEKSTPKLWITRSPLLDGLAGRGPSRISIALSRMRETLKVYVPTPSLDEARAALHSSMCCIIEGPPGIGKTTLAYILAAELIADGYEPIFISSDADAIFSRIDDENKKYVLVYDDFLGQSTMAELLGKNEDARLADLVYMATSTRRLRFIATTRDYILRRALRKYARLGDIVAANPSIVMKISDHDQITRARVLYNHLYYSELPDDVLRTFRDIDKVMTIISHRNYNPRLIAGFSALPTANQPGTDGPSLLNSYLDDPQQIRVSLLDQMQPECADILTVLVTLPESTDVSDVAMCTRSFRRQKGLGLETADFIDALRALEPTFAGIDGDHFGQSESSFVSFTNPSIRDFALLRLGGLLEENLRDLLASLTYWEQVALIGELVFLGDREASKPARSQLRLRYVHSRADVWERATRSLFALAGSTDEFAIAVARTLMAPSPRTRWQHGAIRLHERIALLLTWPPEILNALITNDPNFPGLVLAGVLRLSVDDRFAVASQALKGFDKQSAAAKVLLEPSFRRVAAESLELAEAYGQDRLSWSKSSEWSVHANRLAKVGQIIKLFPFDQDFQLRFNQCAQSATTQLLALIEAFVGYSIAFAKWLEKEDRERVGNQPETRTSRELSRDRLDPYNLHFDEPYWPETAALRRIAAHLGRTDSGSPAIPYLPSPELLEKAISALQAVFPFADQTSLSAFHDIVSIATDIATGGNAVERLIQDLDRNNRPGPSSRATRTTESESRRTIEAIFRNITRE